MGPNLYLGDADPVFIAADRTVPGLPVPLAPDTQRWLSSSGRPGFSEIFVLLRRIPAGSHLLIQAGDRVVGALSPSAAAIYEPFVAAGESAGQPVAAEAALRRAPDATATLHLYLPRP